MYTATSCSGNLPNFLHILCNEPFSQNLRSCKHGVTKYLTRDVLKYNIEIVLSLLEPLVLDDIRMLGDVLRACNDNRFMAYIQVLEQVDL
jgi:hypothetical protein